MTSPAAADWGQGGTWAGTAVGQLIFRYSLPLLLLALPELTPQRYLLVDLCWGSASWSQLHPFLFVPLQFPSFSCISIWGLGLDGWQQGPPSSSSQSFFKVSSLCCPQGIPTVILGSYINSILSFFHNGCSIVITFLRSV